MSLCNQPKQKSRPRSGPKTLLWSVAMKLTLAAASQEAYINPRSCWRCHTASTHSSLTSSLSASTNSSIICRSTCSAFGEEAAMSLETKSMWGYRKEFLWSWLSVSKYLRFPSAELKVSSLWKLLVSNCSLSWSIWTWLCEFLSFNASESYPLNPRTESSK